MPDASPALLKRTIFFCVHCKWEVEADGCEGECPFCQAHDLHYVSWKGDCEESTARNQISFMRRRFL